MRQWNGAIAILLALTALPALAAPRCYAETGQCLDGRIGDYWDRNGGLAVFGFPITGEAPEPNRDTGDLYQTQWMERNRFEVHPENAAPYDILLGRLGDDRLRQLGIDWRTEPKAPAGAPHYFAATGHAIAHEPFWQYWRGRGLSLGDPGISERESLALWGLPLTEARTETNASGDTVLTQWFERARFEWHPDNPEPYKVLLGLLGSELRGGAQPNPSVPPVPSIPPPIDDIPPSFNNCQEDPYADRAPNFPVQMTVDKDKEVVFLRNVSGTAVNLAGWRVCSIRGNQMHAVLNITLAAGQTITIPSQSGGNIWSNNDRDDGALYDATGLLVSYWRDPE